MRKDYEAPAIVESKTIQALLGFSTFSDPGGMTQVDPPS